jgi:hypothetical protein
MKRRAEGLSGRLTDQPELNVAVFAFLLNYPWEFLQVPLYLGMAEASHWEAIKICTRATFGDVLIMLVSYWIVAAVARTRWWILSSRVAQLVIFATVGVSITVIIEHFAVRSASEAWGWRYAPAMPIVPLLGAGLTPVLQWIVLPPLAAWFVKRQLGHLASRREPQAR